MVTKTKILLAVLLLAISLFNQEISTDDKGIVKDERGLSTGLTKREYDQFVADYAQKLAELGFITANEAKADNSVVQDVLRSRFNLNAVEELKQLGITPSYGWGYYGTIPANAIFWGTIKHVSDNLEYFEVEVKEILKGEEYLIANYGYIPQTIRLANPINDGGDAIQKSYIGLRVICDPTSKLIKSQESTEPYFRNAWHTIIVQKNGKIDGKDNLDSYLQKIRKILEVNDEKKFYKRKYRVKGGK